MGDEGFTELQREFKGKCRECDFQKRDLKSMEHELDILKQQLAIKDRLIEDSGFVFVSGESGEPILQKQSEDSALNGPISTGAILVSPESRTALEKAEGSTLGSLSTLNQLSTKLDASDSKTSDLSIPSLSSDSNVSDSGWKTSCEILHVDGGLITNTYVVSEHD